MRLFQDLVNILLRSLVRYKIMWENTVITNAGIELLKNALSGGTITVTAIKSGAGKVDVSALKSQTAVSSIKQSGTVQGVTKTNETIKIGVLFSNAGLSAGYSMTQLGIYAKGSTGSEVLFVISQSTTGKEVPAESAMPSWSLVHNFYIKLNNDVKMTATVDPEGYVTFETMQTALNTHTGNKSNPHSVTKSQVGLGNVPNVATNDQTPTYSDTTTLVTLSSGEKISIAFAKIKLAITTLINHLANKSNPHGVTKSQVGLGNVENKSSATIRGELTKGNVTTALGFTPANQTDMTNAQDAITQLNSDKENKSNKIFKNNGQSNDITIEFENIAEVSKKCDKFPVLFWGTANGNPVFAQFLISLENLHISQVITSNVTNSITASIDWYSLTVHGLSHYGFFVFEAPPGVKIKQNGIDI
nr:MAG TPA: Minor structural protein [Caudoviricetes sp.]